MPQQLCLAFTLNKLEWIKEERFWIKGIDRQGIYVVGRDVYLLNVWSPLHLINIFDFARAFAIYKKRLSIKCLCRKKSLMLLKMTISRKENV